MNIPRAFQPLGLAKSYLLTFEERVPWCFIFNGWYKHRDAWTEFVVDATSTEHLAVALLLFESAIKPWAQCQAFRNESVPEILPGMFENTSDAVTDLNFRRLRKNARAKLHDDDDDDDIELNQNRRWGKRDYCTAVPSKRQHAIFVWLSARAATILGRRAAAKPADPTDAGNCAAHSMDAIEIDGPAESPRDVGTMQIDDHDKTNRRTHPQAVDPDIVALHGGNVEQPDPQPEIVLNDAGDADGPAKVVDAVKIGFPDADAVAGQDHDTAKDGEVSRSIATDPVTNSNASINPSQDAAENVAESVPSHDRDAEESAELWKTAELAAGHSARMDRIFAQAIEAARRKQLFVEEREKLEATQANIRAAQANLTAALESDVVDVADLPVTTGCAESSEMAVNSEKLDLVNTGAEDAEGVIEGDRPIGSLNTDTTQTGDLEDIVKQTSTQISDATLDETNDVEKAACGGPGEMDKSTNPGQSIAADAEGADSNGHERIESGEPVHLSQCADDEMDTVLDAGRDVATIKKESGGLNQHADEVNITGTADHDIANVAAVADFDDNDTDDVDTSALSIKAHSGKSNSNVHHIDDSSADLQAPADPREDVSDEAQAAAGSSLAASKDTVAALDSTESAADQTDAIINLSPDVVDEAETAVKQNESVVDGAEVLSRAQGDSEEGDVEQDVDPDGADIEVAGSTDPDDGGLCPPVKRETKSSELCQKSKFCDRLDRHVGKCNRRLQGVTNVSSVETGPKKKRSVRCKICGEIGHMAKTCKKRFDSTLVNSVRQATIDSASRRSGRATKSTRIYNAGVRDDADIDQANKEADFSPKTLEHEPEACYEIEKIARRGLGEHRNVLRLSSRLLRKAARRGGRDKFPGVLYRTQGVVPVCRTMWRVRMAKARTASSVLLGLSVLEASISWSSWSGPKTRNQNRRNQEGHVTVVGHRVSDWRTYFLAKICEIKYNLQDGTPYPTYREEWIREDRFPKLYEIYKYMFAIKKAQDDERAKRERERAIALRHEQMEAEREARRQEQVRKAEQRQAAEAARIVEQKRQEDERQRAAVHAQVAAKEAGEREWALQAQVKALQHQAEAGKTNLSEIHHTCTDTAAGPQTQLPHAQGVAERSSIAVAGPISPQPPGYTESAMTSVSPASRNKSTPGLLQQSSAQGFGGSSATSPMYFAADSPAMATPYSSNQLMQHSAIHQASTAASGWSPFAHLPWSVGSGLPAQLSIPLGHLQQQLQVPMYESRFGNDYMGSSGGWDGTASSWETRGATLVRQNKDAKQRAKKLAAFRKQQKRKKEKAQKDAIAREKQACKGAVKWIIDQVVHTERNEIAELNRMMRKRERERREAARVEMELAKQQQAEAKREARRKQKLLQEHQRRERAERAAVNKHRGSLQKHTTRVEMLKLTLLYKLEDELHTHSRGGKRNRSRKRGLADNGTKRDATAIDATSTEPQLFCICKTPSDLTRNYVWCNGCSDWYHYECVGYTEDDATTNLPFWCKPCESVRYFAEEDDSARSIAAKLGTCTPAELVAANLTLIPGINQTIKVKAGTPFVVPGRVPVKHPPPLVSPSAFKAQQAKVSGNILKLEMPQQGIRSTSKKGRKNGAPSKSTDTGTTSTAVAWASGSKSAGSFNKKQNKRKREPIGDKFKKTGHPELSSKSSSSAAVKDATLSPVPSKKHKKKKSETTAARTAPTSATGMLLKLEPLSKKSKKKAAMLPDKLAHPKVGAPPGHSKKKSKSGPSASVETTLNDSLPFSETIVVARAPYRPRSTKKKSAMKRIPEPIAAQMELLLRALYLDDVSFPFRDPVTDELAPLYSSIIARPMDLTRVAQKLADRQYSSIDQFEADINLIVSNCHLYNEPLSHIGLEASALQARYKLMLSSFGPPAWDCRLSGDLRPVLKKTLKGVLSDPDSGAFQEPVSVTDCAE